MWCRLYLSQAVSKHLTRLHLDQSHFWSRGSTVARKTNAFNSMCLVLRVEPLRLIIPSAAEASQHKICCVVSIVSSAWHPNFNNQFHCCRKPFRQQASASAATNSSSPLQSANVDCFLLEAVIGYQVCLAPMTHVPRLIELSPSYTASQLGQSITAFQQAVGRFSVRLHHGSSQVARRLCRHLADFEHQVSAQFSEDLCDDLVCSSQQYVFQCGVRVILASSCEYKQMSSILGTKPHFLRICSRWSCQRLGALLRPLWLYCGFQFTVPLPGSSVPDCHSRGGFAFVSEVCCLGE